MLTACPQCQIDVFADPPGACPRCGIELPAATAAAAHQATPLVIGDDGVESPTLEAIPEPHLGWAIFAVFVSGAVASVASIFLVFAASVFHPPVFGDYDLICTLAFVAGSSVMFLMAWIALQPRPRARLALVRPSAIHLLIALLLALPLQILCMGGEYYAQSIWLEATSASSTTAAGAAVHEIFDHWYAYKALARQPWVCVFIIGCIMPALAEEAFFRAFLGRGLVARYGVWPGILLTSALFGVVHWEPSHIASAFVLGIFLHVLYLCSHSLWPPALLHLANNAIAFGFLKLEGEGLLPWSLSAELLAGAMIPLAAFAVLGLLLLLWRTRGAWRNDDGSPLERRFVAVESPVTVSARLQFRQAGFATWSVALIALGSFTIAVATFAEGQRGPIAAVAVLKDAEEARSCDEYERALELFTQATELSPRDASAWWGRSYANLMLGNHHAALKAADRCLELSPDYSYALATKAAALVSMRRGKEALPHALRAAQLLPEDSWICFVWMQAAVAARDYETVIAAAKKGRHLDKSNAHFPRVLAEIYSSCPHESLRDSYQAMIMAEDACDRSNYKDPQALLTLASIRLLDGDRTRSLQLIETAIENSDGFLQAFAKQWARDMREFGSAVALLRSRWLPTVVDDVTLYKLTRQCFIFVSLEQLSRAKDNEVDVPELANWEHTVMTLPQFEDHLYQFVDRLKKDAGLTEVQAVTVAWNVAPDAEAFGKVPCDELAAKLGWESSEVARVKQCLTAGE